MTEHTFVLAQDALNQIKEIDRVINKIDWFIASLNDGRTAISLHGNDHDGTFKLDCNLFEGELSKALKNAKVRLHEERDKLDVYFCNL